MSVSQGFYFTIQLKTPEYYFKINLTIQKNALNVSFHAAHLDWMLMFILRK